MSDAQPQPAAQKTEAPLAQKPATPSVTTTQFDVALADPHQAGVEHWPRMRVTVELASVTDLTDEQKKPLPGESAEAGKQRLAALVCEIEHKRAIDAYNEAMGLTGQTHLRYDVQPAKDAAPVLSEAWQKHLCPKKGAPYFQRLAKEHEAATERATSSDATDEHKDDAARVARLRADIKAAGVGA